MVDQSTDQQPTPAAVPWYKSQIIQAMLAIVAARIVSILVTKLGIASMLAAFGVTQADLVTALVQYATDGLIFASVWLATHARIVKALPIVVSTQAKADIANAAAKAVAAAAAAAPK